jgi:uncharacterized protein (DUF58 family)
VDVLPSRRLLVLLAGAATLFLVGTAPALAANGVILAAALLDLVRLRGSAPLRAERRAPARLPLGGEGEVVISVVNPAPRAVAVRLTDDLSPNLARTGDDWWDLVVDGGEEAHVRYLVRAEERGTAEIGDVHLRVLGPLGLVWRQERRPLRDRVRVQPGLSELRRYRLLAHRNRLLDVGNRTMPDRGEGTAFESLREYARGDDPRRIDWKATAKRGTLIVRQTEAERSQSVLLAIDAGRLMVERLDGWEGGSSRERLDFALASALLLADVAAEHGDRVGLFVFADRVQRFIPPGRSALDRLAGALAEVQPQLVEPDYPGAFGFLARQLRRRSLLVLFTDVIDTRASRALLAQLAAARRRHLPLAIALRNPALEAAAVGPAGDLAGVYQRAAAEELLLARALALAEMQRAGVLVADTRPADAAPTVVNRYLQVKRKGLL